MTVDLGGYPYPHPRHVPNPDPFRLTDWLREIGALPPERRVTDVLTIQPRDRKSGATP